VLLGEVEMVAVIFIALVSQLPLHCPRLSFDLFEFPDHLVSQLFEKLS
jgi:hypothetical protein